MLDELDLKILRRLMSAGRTTWAELASDCGVSAPAIAERVRRLERQRVIVGYAARLSAAQLGYDITAFVSVSLERPQHRAAFLDYVQQTAEIQECHHVTGAGDYLLKIRCRNTAALEQLISEDIKGLAGVVQTQTSIALSTVKEGAALPI
ncbi:MAG: Lrp/AsnC family transcriptional regulator [Leptolyngbya sp. SIO4C1]|nr:Lrp/AsnC family transcriptional regulator [Leptolyngbya sp. SIO4C1]